MYTILGTPLAYIRDFFGPLVFSDYASTTSWRIVQLELLVSLLQRFGGSILSISQNMTLLGQI